MSGAYRREIDGLRGLAVLAVVLFHAGVPGFAGGFVGVDVFLVISGYLITGLIQREAGEGTFTLVGFYERRVRRILPALLAMLAVCGVAAWILLPADFKQFGASLAAVSVFLSNFFFAHGSGYFRLAAGGAPLLHTWSLAIEEQFYLLFPVLLLSARRLGARGVRIALAIATLLSLLYSAWAVSADPAMAFYSPASRAWEFLAGSLLASGVIKTPARRDIGDVAAVVGSALLGFSIWRFRAETAFPGLNALAPVLGTVLLLQGSAAPASRAARLLSLRPLEAVGVISYSLYLWHWPLIVFGAYYVLDDHLLGIVRAAMAGLAFPIAWASWRYIEQPFRAPRLLLSRGALFICAAAASIALAGYGALIHAGEGFPWRFSPPIQRLSDRGEAPDYGCTGQPIESLPTTSGCRIGDPAVAPSFVLWGDSHAAVYAPALRRLAQAHGVSGYEITATGCPPLFVADPPDRPDAPGKNIAARNRQIAECRERDVRAAQFISQTGPRVVVLAAHWAAYDSGKHAEPGASDRDLFEQGVRALRDQGIAVYVVLDVPEAARLNTDQLAKARVISAAAHIEPSLAAYLRRTAAMRVQAFDLQSRGLVEVIEPAQLLCALDPCRMTDGDYPLYYDSNHLNARGAQFVGPLFEPMFRYLDAGRPPQASASHRSVR